ncbi:MULTISPECIES: UDP-N-acetylmuramoyl-tripeptide--D-alanyl-D-alanine ligase [Mesonia]|uniref:UDP-N-acetylmuramoyl-tripeptide--D-alanyl-D-alanine ligase n=1 Tax=Mesonia oceanica TaxID=2687242 RepID=A0AC61Y5H0_9FLAO|nr:MULTISPECIES: UDP-N-acetylmuramoyl-tripeptide--D-alanyl-D-alanine ligase [Mesonia]MAN28928.1 UDP-N-acetylmuramoyl-tripeptide--D-alanyl-D-alanine ligase [Mesonia sp.]MAQ42709.1 UDP-N-acetylmuramoyl-tripeptide--D-alanyl-D-alanine ligase [Mesonia sp.]MBJ99246.1 UDP-N-acetylmuramoyl-tripeptide--D-alanyl-D-alanine ligase [Flavobacteriaceae bacterium]VVU99755.1 UDP-N-acetylmuramoyl-tripeptide--D-alanyl-D-alanine ligase [Mesonia oceanica]|tara:strand:+ start:79642 stop:80916 length:1275 start_codon:yes stop_codon:yes gene_type:complete
MEINQLHHLFLESTGICTDTRKLKKGNIFFALKGDNFNGNNFAKSALEDGANYVVIDEKKETNNNRFIQVKDCLKTLQQLANYHRKFLNIPIIAITGSNGKTTTKELIREVLSKKFKTVSTQGNLNNHIGVPLTLLSMNKQTEMGIVEMGANHQGEIEALCKITQPDYGYITNFGKAHLEGFGGVEGVIKGKSELYRHLIKNEKTIFINYDDEIQVEKSKGTEVISFSEGNEATYQITFVKASPYVEISTEELEIHSKLIGNYNAKNIAAAICIGSYFKVPQQAIKEAIETYSPNNNRSQIIQKNTNQIILDAYNANPTSMKAALENLKAMDTKNKVVVLGDMFEIGNTASEEHQNIVNLLEEYNFSQAYVCGSNFHGVHTNNIQKFKDFESLSKHLKNTTIKNSTILIKGSRGMKLERVLDFI